jgi:hypothetical protein
VMRLRPRHHAGVAQLVEHLPSKQNVVGSNPIARSNYPSTIMDFFIVGV